MAEADAAPEPLAGKLQPSEGVNDNRVRVDERADIDNDDTGIAALYQHADALAERRETGASDRTADDQDDRVGLGERSQRKH
jgi:hypothetical protein